MGGVTAIKKTMRELQSQGIGSRQAEILSASDQAPKKKKKKKAGEASTELSGSLFDGDGREDVVPRKTRVYPGGGTSGHLRKETGKSPREMARLKRGGKGRHAFKGKKRYKR